ncbi:unnamed protein product [Ectocarpus sp. CCAP 1310/34]|nr:unnamed protein product [Ectocarpus sp. CCAP 1310/34]
MEAQRRCSAPATPATRRNSRSVAHRASFYSATATPRAYCGSSRASTPASERTASLGHPASFLDNDDTGKSNCSDDSYSGRADSSGGGGSGGGRSFSVRGRTTNKSCSGSTESGSDGGGRMSGKREPSTTVTAGSAVRLSAEASAILNAWSPPAAGAVLKLCATAPVSTVSGARWQGKPKALVGPLALDRAVSSRPMEPALPEKPAVVIKAAGARMLKRLGSQIEFWGDSGDESDSTQVSCGIKYGRTETRSCRHCCGVLLGGLTAVGSPHLFVSSVPIAPGRDRSPPSDLSVRETRKIKVFNRNTTAVHGAVSPDPSSPHRPNSCYFPPSTRLIVFGLRSATLRVPRRVARTRNPLQSFHVCPLLLREKLCDGGGRPVQKFVFACPGTAAALVSHTDGCR